MNTFQVSFTYHGERYEATVQKIISRLDDHIEYRLSDIKPALYGSDTFIFMVDDTGGSPYLKFSLDGDLELLSIMASAIIDSCRKNKIPLFF